MFPYERVLAEMKKDGILQFLPLADVKGQFLERSTFLASYIEQIIPVGSGRGSSATSDKGLPLPSPHDDNPQMVSEAAHTPVNSQTLLQYDFTLSIFVISY